MKQKEELIAYLDAKHKHTGLREIISDWTINQVVNAVDKLLYDHLSDPLKAAFDSFVEAVLEEHAKQSKATNLQLGTEESGETPGDPDPDDVSQ